MSRFGFLIEYGTYFLGPHMIPLERHHSFDPRGRSHTFTKSTKPSEHKLLRFGDVTISP